MKKQLISMAVAAMLVTACGGTKTTTAEADQIDYTVEQFARFTNITLPGTRIRRPVA